MSEMNLLEILIKRIQGTDEIPYLDEEDREIVLQIIRSLRIGDLKEEIERQSELEAISAYISEKYRRLESLSRDESDRMYHKLAMQSCDNSLSSKTAQWKAESFIKDNPDYQALARRTSDLSSVARFLEHLRWAVLTRFKALEQLSINERQERKGMNMSV